MFPCFYISESFEWELNVWGWVLGWFFFPPGFAEFVSGRREMSAHSGEVRKLWRGDAFEGKGAEARALLAPGKAVRGSFCQNALSLPVVTAPSWYEIALSPNASIHAFPLEKKMQQAAHFLVESLGIAQ